MALLSTTFDGDKGIIRLQDISMRGVDRLPDGRGIISSVIYLRRLTPGMLHKATELECCREVGV